MKREKLNKTVRQFFDKVEKGVRQAEEKVASAKKAESPSDKKSENPKPCCP